MALITDIATKIKAKLDGLAVAGQKLAYVAEDHDGELQGFPAATFELATYEGEAMTNVENLRKFTFEIVVHLEIEKKTRAQALALLHEALYDVIVAFENDLTLTGTVHYCKPIFEGRKGTHNSPQGATIYFVMKLECVKEVAI